ncbi:MAG: hypothetical protein K9K30_10440 [Burkholderiaceae bacterium]|nr:hypothetical protein [Burkholderiaceae bacterium]
MSQAREALIGYAVRYREDQINDNQLDRVYGYLPLPDLGSTRNNNGTDPNCFLKEGCESQNFLGNAINNTVIGRFPWRTLGTGPLKDSNGECLWYAVSGSHQRQQRVTPMNWDTLSQLDVVIADGTAAMVSAITSAHERPIAVVFSAGPPLPGQDRSASATDAVTECGGNYVVANYLDPVVATDLGGVTNYLPGTNGASGDTSGATKSLSAGGINNRRGNSSIWSGECPKNDAGACATVANDTGAAITSEILFRTLRGSSNFRTDINTMLDRMTNCLRDEIIANGGSLSPAKAKIAGADANTCYGAGLDPLGYYPHYKEMIFVAAPGSANVTVDNVLQPSCAGALVFAGQRDTQTLRCPVGSPTSVQRRSTGTEKTDSCNYLEDPNLTSFTGAGTAFSGQSQFERVTTTQAVHQDIVRCIPTTKSFTEAPSALPVGSELSTYDAATRTLTLGRANIESDLGYSASKLFGCVWTPEAHATGSGVRGYFKFQITDTGSPGEGFTFAAIDGDRNGPTVCGASVQHMGYSGNNAFTPIIAHPKIGIEFDTRRSYEDGSPYGFSDPIGFDPGWLLASPISTSHLNNGRGDPDYAGGHMGIVYWGTENPIKSDRSCFFSSCPSPMFCNASDKLCYLDSEEDDNVHGRIITLPTSRPHPRNPFALPAVPASPAGVYKLDPSLSQVPHNLNHVRVEIDRTSNTGRDDHGKRVRVVATGNLSLSGLQTIDSISLAAGNRVLLVAQTDAKFNGVWIAAAGAWARATTENEGLEFPAGSSWFVNEGNSYTGTLWRLQNTEAIVVGSSQIKIARFRDPVRAVATGNLTLSGLQTVDGVSLASGDRVLLTNQTTASQNGVYHASGGAWIRATLEGTVAGMKAGATWYVKEGGGAGRFWHTTADAIPGGAGAIGISLVTSAANDIYFSTMKTQVWKLPDSPTSANQIAKMKLTSRQLSVLDPTHLPLLADTATVYDLKGATCNSSLVCASGEFCGIDNNCYSPAFRTMRLGFTNSQSTRDQVINITDFATTWLQ